MVHNYSCGCGRGGGSIEYGDNNVIIVVSLVLFRGGREFKLSGLQIELLEEGLIKRVEAAEGSAFKEKCLGNTVWS